MHLFHVLLLLVIAGVATATNKRIEEKLLECAEEAGISIETRGKLESFSIDETDIGKKELQWMVCAMKKYYILKNDGKLNDDTIIANKFRNYNQSVIAELLAEFKAVNSSSDIETYSYGLYEALGNFARKHTMLSCGKKYGIDLRPAKQLQMFDKNGINVTDNIINFIECFLKRKGILSNDTSELQEEVLKEKFKDEDGLINSLWKVPQKDDKRQYAFDIYNAIEEWKQNKNLPNSSTRKNAHLLLFASIPLILLALAIL